jgi:hypothetical protein
VGPLLQQAPTIIPGKEGGEEKNQALNHQGVLGERPPCSPQEIHVEPEDFGETREETASAQLTTTLPAIQEQLTPCCTQQTSFSSCGQPQPSYSEWSSAASVPMSPNGWQKKLHAIITLATGLLAQGPGTNQRPSTTLPEGKEETTSTKILPNCETVSTNPTEESIPKKSPRREDKTNYHIPPFPPWGTWPIPRVHPYDMQRRAEFLPPIAPHLGALQGPAFFYPPPAGMHRNYPQAPAGKYYRPQEDGKRKRHHPPDRREAEDRPRREATYERRRDSRSSREERYEEERKYTTTRHEDKIPRTSGRHAR